MGKGFLLLGGLAAAAVAIFLGTSNNDEPQDEPQEEPGTQPNFPHEPEGDDHIIFEPEKPPIPQ